MSEDDEEHAYDEDAVGEIAQAASSQMVDTSSSSGCTATLTLSAKESKSKRRKNDPAMSTLPLPLLLPRFHR